jgi:hypothetical protein
MNRMCIEMIYYSFFPWSWLTLLKCQSHSAYGVVLLLAGFDVCYVCVGELLSGFTVNLQLWW